MAKRNKLMLLAAMALMYLEAEPQKNQEIHKHLHTLLIYHESMVHCSQQMTIKYNKMQTKDKIHTI